MFVLSEQQVSFILDDIRRNGIELEELQLNLLDHICCVIENEMSPEQDFDEFYRIVITRFYKRELREIQEETELVLTFKHYYTMKKVMLLSGTFAAIGIIIGSFFKVMHWPGAAVLFVLSIFILSFIFLPILFLIKAKEVKEKREKITLGIATLFGILVSISSLFKVMHWPGATIMWLISLGILIFIFLPIYFFGGIKNSETKMNTIVTSVLILFAGGLLFLLTSLRPSQQIHYLFASSIQGIDKAYAFASKQNELKYASLSTDSTKSQADLSELKNSCNSLCSKIEAAKKQIIDFASFGQNPKPNLEMLLSENAGNFNLPMSFLFTNNDQPKPIMKALKSDVKILNILLKEKFHKENLLLLNISDIDRYGNPKEGKISWENAKFCRVPFELVLINFNQLELDVRLMEASCL